MSDYHCPKCRIRTTINREPAGEIRCHNCNSILVPLQTAKRKSATAPTCLAVAIVVVFLICLFFYSVNQSIIEKLGSDLDSPASYSPPAANPIVRPIAKRTPRPTVIDKSSEMRLGFTRDERKAIYSWDYFTDMMAFRIADYMYSYQFSKDLRPGDNFKLTRITALPPVPNALEALSRLDEWLELYPGSVIVVMEVLDRNDGYDPMYDVDVYDSLGGYLCSGWVSGGALYGQNEDLLKLQISRRNDTADEMREYFQNEIAKQHKISVEELRSIWIEGYKFKWPEPDPPPKEQVIEWAHAFYGERPPIRSVN